MSTNAKPQTVTTNVVVDYVSKDGEVCSRQERVPCGNAWHRATGNGGVWNLTLLIGGKPIEVSFFLPYVEDEEAKPASKGPIKKKVTEGPAF